MKFLAIEKELESHGFSEEILKREAAQVWELEKAGIIREIYFKKEIKEAIIILECENMESAALYLSTLPLVQENLSDFSISELIPYDGYDRLFASS